MSSNNSHKLTKRQLAVIDDLFTANLDENQLLVKHRLKPNLLRKWLSCRSFCDELEFRTESARRQSRMLIARFAHIAAAKLVALTESEKEETARKACLDIISLTGRAESKTAAAETQQSDPLPQSKPIPQGVAAKLLDVLANENI